MKTLFLILVLGLPALAAVPHYEMELTGPEYRNALEATGLRAKGDLKEPLDRGKRSLDWLIHINQRRPPEKQISLSTPASMPAYPIDTPRVLNPDGVMKDLAAVKAEAPEWYRKVVFENAPFTDDTPAGDEAFVKWGLRMDYVYQGASRWTLLEPYLSQLAALKSKDLRGYYRLTREPGIEPKLAAWGSLGAEDQDRLRPSLVGLCLNGGASEVSCRRAIAAAESQPGALLKKYRAWLPAGTKIWDGFYAIPATRPDARWTAKDPAHFFLPFQEPETADVRSFLVDNIEDEWRVGTEWQLKLDFTTSGGKDTAHVVFEPGATPNVNDLAGSTITMDANTPLTEYAVRWTIRHEFGHVLGFPDCYHEFYDGGLKALVSYQLDISDLMCSRRGKLKTRHYEELKRVYYKG